MTDYIQINKLINRDTATKQYFQIIPNGENTKIVFMDRLIRQPNLTILDRIEDDIQCTLKSYLVDDQTIENTNEYVIIGYDIEYNDIIHKLNLIYFTNEQIIKNYNECSYSTGKYKIVYVYDNNVEILKIIDNLKMDEAVYLLSEVLVDNVFERIKTN